MSLFMDLDSDWLPDGSQLIVDYDSFENPTFSSWEGYDALTLTQINGNVAVHSPAAAMEAMDYGMYMENFMVSKSPVVEVEQYNQEMLPGSPETGHLSSVEFQQYLAQMQLEMVSSGMQFAANNGSVTSPDGTVKQQMVNWEDFQATTSGAFDIVHRAMTLPDQAFATVPECEEDDVMDLLNQLSDRVDGDMYIDPVKLEAFVSFPLDPVSPDDVESLISSQLSAVDTQYTNKSSSSFRVVAATEMLMPLSPLLTTDDDSSVVDGPVLEKKRKKQDQNKSAAIRYRQKKRNQHGTVTSECEELERRNIELKTRVSEMAKEVDYLKGLIEEICAA